MKTCEKVCENCGQPFTAKSKFAKYCSERCGAKFRSKKNKAEKPEVEKVDSCKTKVKVSPLRKRFFAHYPKVCEVCGREFLAVLPHAKYCSQECVNQAHFEQANKGKKTHNRVCPVCGKRFNTTAGNKKYCSEGCQKSVDYNKKHPSRLSELSIQAEQCGLSYGKYTAQLRLGKTYEELYAAHQAELKRMEEI